MQTIHHSSSWNNLTGERKMCHFTFAKYFLGFVQNCQGNPAHVSLPWWTPANVAAHLCDVDGMCDRTKFVFVSV